MTRIAMVNAGPFPSPQGSQVFTGQMAAALAARGHEVHLLTYGQGQEVTGSGFVHHRIARLPGDDATRSGPTALKPLLDSLMIGALTALVRRESIEVVHAHNYEAAIVAIAARAVAGAPVVYHSHNVMRDELSTYFERPTAKRLADAAGRMLDRNIPRRADHTIALCDHSAQVLSDAGVEGARLSVIPAAAADDIEWSSRDSARRLLGLSQDALVAAYVGNLDGYQNLDVLLDAVADLESRSADSRIQLLVASHRIDESFRFAVSKRALGGRLVLVEAAEFSHAKTAIEAADVLALPRRLGSGYPIKLLNFMSAARAVVTAGCGAKVLRDGIDGVVVADDNPKAMAEALAALLADPARRDTLGAAARQRFLRELTWETVLPRVESIYDGLLRGTGDVRGGQWVDDRT